MSKKLKQPKCGHQFENERYCQPAFRNVYECDECDTTWEDVWSCGVDDECPNCGRNISPTTSKRIAACACEYLGAHVL